MLSTGRSLVLGGAAAASLSLVAVTGAQTSGSTPASLVPLREGLTIVTALHQPERGDYESIKTIVRVDERSVRLRYAADLPDNDDEPSLDALFGVRKPPKDTGKPGRVRQIHTYRTILRDDLERATEYRLVFNDGHPETFSGSTAVGVSRLVLQELKTKGTSPLAIPPGGLAGGLASMLGAILGDAAKDLGIESMHTGMLERVGAQSVPFTVLLNDRETELPAIHVKGMFEGQDAEFWFLDDPENPLALKWTIGEGRLQVIRLSYPVVVTSAASQDVESGRSLPKTLPPGSGAGVGGRSGAGGGGGSGRGSSDGLGSGASNAAAGTAARIEEEIAKTGRAIVYGIYFDFASDRIKEESEPVLAEIAQVLRQNPDWRLAVEGHTDSIGGDRYNLDLSQRRSAAVKQALTTRYQIDAARLATAGYGASSPKDRNDTLEGRARNRRVELVKAN